MSTDTAEQQLIVPTYHWDDLRDEQKQDIEERVIALLEKADGLWIYGLPMERYLAIDAMSSSGINTFGRRSPAHFRHDRDNPSEPTQRMLDGSALHAALLEPKEFDERYVVLGQCAATKGDGTRCSNPGKVYRDGQSFCGIKSHDPADGAPMEPGIEVVQEERKKDFQAAAEAVRSHPDAGRFFTGDHDTEVTGVWKDPDTGVPCKIRLDVLPQKASIHADVKMTDDASSGSFYYRIKRLGYDRKSAWYRRGMEALGRPAIGSVLIAVEDTAPYGVQAFVLDEDDLQIIDVWIDEKLEQYAECLESGEWPGYPTGFTPIEMKSWDLPDVELSDDEEF